MIYVLVKHYEANFDYGWDYSPTELLKAYSTKELANQKKEEIEKEEGGDVWEEDDFTCCLTIEEVELV